MRYHSYLNSAKKIIETYRGDLPFAIFLKKYFSAHRKYGGKDRKQIAALCFDFYRLGKAIPKLPVEEKIIAASFLCENTSSAFLHFHKPEWNGIITKPAAEKLKVLGFAIDELFPWQDELSAGIEFEAFGLSFFNQPDLFLRIRPGYKEVVIKKLQDAGFKFELVNNNCIALPNSTKLDALLEIDKEVIIQDHNSQQVLDYLKTADVPHPESSIQYQESSTRNPGSGTPISVWDCCAASGGKSILAYDIFNGQVNLSVSDIRESILANLKKRFETAGIKNYQSFIADLSVPNSPLPTPDSGLLTPNSRLSSPVSQLIICDAPCTGSGTWSRTPEQLYYFKKKTIDAHVHMQQRIVAHVIPHLPGNGLFIYITCSVFKAENEEMVNFIKEKFQLQLLQMELLKGYNYKADTMFVAVFKKTDLIVVRSF